MDTDNSEPQTGFRVADGLQIRYAETGRASSQRIVLTSPWPESLHAFRRVWPRLSKTAGLLAIDLPGFGRSERRTDLLSPLPMSEFIVRLLDEWGISEPHLVSPDVGTAAALFAAAKYPGRFRSLVVGTGASAFPLQVSGLLKDIIEAPHIDGFRALKPDALVHGAIEGMGSATPADDVIADYIESNSGDRFAESTRYVRSYPEQLPILRDRLPEILTPVQIITGRRDPLVPVGNAEYLHERLPNSRLDVLDTGHFVWEEAAEQYASLIVEWVSGGYLTGPIKPVTAADGARTGG
jgi:pimeloyl-ACP methyl ester carboxylesterase